MKSAIELLEAAQNDKEIKVELNIPAGDTIIKGYLTPIDFREIQKAQKKARNREIGALTLQGFDKLPIVESDWDKQKKEFRDRLQEKIAGTENEDERAKLQERLKKQIAEFEKNKPVNQAEQMAEVFSQYSFLEEVIPQFIRNEAGELMFPTIAEQSRLRDLTKKNVKLLILFADAFTELNERMNEIENEIKN
jgi:hypothetical protein